MRPLGFRLWALVIAVSGLLSTGCEIEGWKGHAFECTVQVSPVGDPSYVIELSSEHDVNFVDEDGRSLWNYYLCLDEETYCPPCGFEYHDDVDDEMVEHWGRMIAQRLGELSSDPTSDFARFSQWCEVPETRECGWFDGPNRLVEYPECTDVELVAEQPLSTCEPLDDDACLAIDCGDGPGCTAIDFGPRAVGREARRTVRLSNCGGGGDPAVAISAPRLLVGPNTDADDFYVENGAEAGCRPDDPLDPKILLPNVGDGAGSFCTFDVVFAPSNPGILTGDLVFRGAVPQHEIELSGNGAAGSLQAAPEEICIDFEPGPQCLPPVGVSLANAGPGDLIISSGRINEPNGDPQNFRLVPPQGPDLPLLLPPDGTTLDLLVEWCAGEPRDEQAEIEITSSNPLEPTFRVPLAISQSCPAG